MVYDELAGLPAELNGELLVGLSQADAERRACQANSRRPVV
jgi:hypothetical protein